jgi:serine/threonine-protein kinase
MDVPVRESGCFAFGAFRLDPIRQTLERDGAPIRLAPRLFETLLYLVRNHGRVVTRDELMRAVWPGRTVEQNNLGQAMSTLRKALGDDGLIVTVPWRGYRIAVPVEFRPAATAAADALPAGAGGRHRTEAPFALRRRGMIAFAAAMLVGGLGWRLMPSPHHAGKDPPFAAPPRSVAVLAFSNMTGDPAQDYFSDGLAEELIDSLGRLPALRVAARQSAFSFKGSRATVTEIGRALGVASVLEGSVRRDGTRLRIAAHLIDAGTGYEVWSGSFEPAPGDLFRMQGTIATAVTAALQVKLLGQDAARLTEGGTSHAAAFDFYLHGMQLVHADNPAGFRTALRDFDAAIASDPFYALAYVERALTLQGLTETEGDANSAAVARMQDEAVAAAQRAVALAPELAEAHAVLGRTLLEDRQDSAGAAAELSRARQLAPDDARVNMEYAVLQIALGHVAVAVDAAELAARLDPLTPSTYEQLAEVLSDARRYDEALAAIRHAEQLQSSVTDPDVDALAEIELRQGRPAAALQSCAPAHDWEQILCLAMANHALGKLPQAAAALARLRAMLGDTGAMQYAEIYAQWGQTADALQWLQTAWRLHDPGLLELKIAPEFDSIRATPTFQDIERRMNFPP